MKIQFGGHAYYMEAGNITIRIPGDLVSSPGLGCT